MMTPERRAVIESKLANCYEVGVSNFVLDERRVAFMDAAIPDECLAEIDRLNRVVDQAVSVAEFGYHAQNGNVWIENEDPGELFSGCPDLVAELERRAKS